MDTGTLTPTSGFGLITVELYYNEDTAREYLNLKQPVVFNR